MIFTFWDRISDDLHILVKNRSLVGPDESRRLACLPGVFRDVVGTIHDLL